MPYEIKRQESTGLFIVVDTNTGKTLSRADQPSDAINIAIANGTLPADDKQGLLTEARVVVEKENEVEDRIDIIKIALNKMFNNKNDFKACWNYIICEKL